MEEGRGTGSEETDHHTGRRRRIAVGTAGAHLIRTGYDPGVLPGGHGWGASADPEIDALVAARTDAKKAKNFAEADRIRDELKARGIEIIDTPQGAKWRRV